MFVAFRYRWTLKLAVNNGGDTVCVIYFTRTYIYFTALNLRLLAERRMLLRTKV